MDSGMVLFPPFAIHGTGFPPIRGENDGGVSGYSKTNSLNN